MRVFTRVILITAFIYCNLSNSTSGQNSSWFWQNPLPQGNHLYSVDFLNELTGWAVGNVGTILRTTNGGTDWQVQTSGTTKDLHSVSFTDSNNGTTVGNEGTILKTTDGGTTWIQQSIGITNNLLSVYFTDVNNGMVVGSGGTILSTTNGGVIWSSHTSGTTRDLKDIYFTNANNGATVVGEYGTILGSADGGITWTLQSSGTTWNLSGVSFTDANNGTAVGVYGTILNTTKGGAIFVEEVENDEMPNNYNFSQNYPNPFNPSTKIRYSVPQSSNVVIKVFDILGNEIETLVNDEKDVGTYELTWSAENLPSGIYFYQLQTGNFVETKKMMLMK